MLLRLILHTLAFENTSENVIHHSYKRIPNIQIPSSLLDVEVHVLLRVYWEIYVFVYIPYIVAIWYTSIE